MEGIMLDIGNGLTCLLAAADAHGGVGEITSLFSGQALIALITLTVLEIVLGIDNIIFISVLADKLPLEQQNKARLMGLSLAMIMRILLLLCISWIMSLTTAVPLIGHVLSLVMGDDKPLNWRDVHPASK
jgi:predicted tellurium resistance membrane protein TerC